MEILKQINQLISSLAALKPHIDENNGKTNENFTEELNISIKKLSALTNEPILPKESENASVNEIPSWVDQNYHYDPYNPRNPNTREVMQAISGKSFNELQSGDSETFSHYSKLSIELVFGVLGKNSDTRDWNKIMSSDNILEAARKETGEVLGTTVDIDIERDTNGLVISEFAAVKDKDNNTLRSLVSDSNATINTLKNFGVKKSSIANNLLGKVTSSNFDTSIIETIEAYQGYRTKIASDNSETTGQSNDTNPSVLEHQFLATSANALSNRLMTDAQKAIL